MGDNIIHITDSGLQAANNASAGGVLIDVVSFKLGDSDVAHANSDIDIAGNMLHSGAIHFIEVVDNNSVRFTFTIPSFIIPPSGFVGKEVAFFLADGVMFGRCVFFEPYTYVAGEEYRINALLTTTRCDLSTINVSIGDYSSIPSTPGVYRLPAPNTSDFNVISVLDMLTNSTGDTSAGLAYKHGAGSLHWGFSAHDKVFAGIPDAGATPSSFRSLALESSLNFANGEIVIVQAISGPAAGQTRKFFYTNGSGFLEKDGFAMNFFDAQSTISIWRSSNSSSSSTNNYPPAVALIPADWVLTRGVSNLPVWAPQKGGGTSLNTLYKAPGRLRINTRNEVGTGQVKRYDLGGILVRDVNHCITAIGGITQHKSAYDISSSELEFAGNIPIHAPIDIRLITKEPGTGTYIDFVTNEFIGDSATLRFPISQSIEDAQYAFCYISGILQATTAYTYDSVANEIVFVAPPETGIAIEIISVIPDQREGYSTEVLSTTVITVGDTLFLEMPVNPQTKEHTFVTISGTHIHRNKYTMVENKIVFSSPVRGGLEIEVVIYDNVLSTGTPQTNLKGMVVDAVLTSKSLKLLRHDANPVILPIPDINLSNGLGIKITGSYPDYVISNTFAQQFTQATNFKYSTRKTETDASEIIYTYRINLTADVVLQVTADFSSRLGPGFVTVDALETMEYVIGFKTTGATEPAYGRDIKGTGTAGFSSLQTGIASNSLAYSNASLTQVFEMIAANIPAGYIDLIVKMRVKNANIANFGSKLALDINIVGVPKLN